MPLPVCYVGLNFRAQWSLAAAYDFTGHGTYVGDYLASALDDSSGPQHLVLLLELAPRVLSRVTRTYGWMKKNVMLVVL